MAEDQDRQTRYRKVHLSLWGDENFRALSPQKPSGQALWIYLLIGPHTRNIPGLSLAGEAGLAERLGWSLVSFRRCWQEIETAGMAQADWRNQVVWLPNAFAYNVPANPNVIRGWRPWLLEIPDCQLKTEALTALESLVARLGEPFSKAFTELFPKPFAKRVA